MCIRENQSPWNFNNKAPPTNPIGISIQKTAAILKISLAIVKFNDYYNLHSKYIIFVKNVDNSNILKIFEYMNNNFKKNINIPNYWNWSGFKICWSVTGEENEIPIIFLHGFGASRKHWRNNLESVSYTHLTLPTRTRV